MRREGIPGLSRMYRKKPQKANTGELVKKCEDMSTMFNNDFFSVLTQEDLSIILERVQVYEGGDGDKL